jgi:hypothetical protein
MTSMTVSIMHCCTNKRDERRVRQSRFQRNRVAAHSRWRLFAVVLLWSCISVAWAGGGTVNKAELRPGDEGYRPVVDFSITLNPAVEQALTYGVPLYFVSEFSLVRPRWYWLNETVAQDEQTIRLSYNALTRQYRLTYGMLYQNFENLGDALHILSHQPFAPVPASLLKPGVKYIASVRLHLDLTQLPKPLQINALVGSDWILDTEWYRWDMEVGTLGSVNEPGEPAP